MCGSADKKRGGDKGEKPGDEHQVPACQLDCLSPFTLLLHNAIDLTRCEQLTFISPSSRGWKVQDQGAAALGSAEVYR